MAVEGTKSSGLSVMVVSKPISDVRPIGVESLGDHQLTELFRQVIQAVGCTERCLKPSEYKEASKVCNALVAEWIQYDPESAAQHVSLEQVKAKGEFRADLATHIKELQENIAVLLAAEAQKPAFYATITSVSPTIMETLKKTSQQLFAIAASNAGSIKAGFPKVGHVKDLIAEEEKQLQSLAKEEVPYVGFLTAGASCPKKIKKQSNIAQAVQRFWNEKRIFPLVLTAKALTVSAFEKAAIPELDTCHKAQAPILAKVNESTSIIDEAIKALLSFEAKPKIGTPDVKLYKDNLDAMKAHTRAIASYAAIAKGNHEELQRLFGNGTQALQELEVIPRLPGLSDELQARSRDVAASFSKFLHENMEASTHLVDQIAIYGDYLTTLIPVLERIYDCYEVAVPFRHDRVNQASCENHELTWKNLSAQIESLKSLEDTALSNSIHAMEAKSGDVQRSIAREINCDKFEWLVKVAAQFAKALPKAKRWVLDEVNRGQIAVDESKRLSSPGVPLGPISQYHTTEFRYKATVTVYQVVTSVKNAVGSILSKFYTTSA